MIWKVAGLYVIVRKWCHLPSARCVNFLCSIPLHVIWWVAFCAVIKFEAEELSVNCTELHSLSLLRLSDSQASFHSWVKNGCTPLIDNESETLCLPWGCQSAANVSESSLGKWSSVREDSVSQNSELACCVLHEPCLKANLFIPFLNISWLHPG